MKQNSTKLEFDDNDIEFIMFVLSIFQFLFTLAMDYTIVRLQSDGHIEEKYCTCPHQEPARICPECKKERKKFDWPDCFLGHAAAALFALGTHNPEWLDMASFVTLSRFWAASLVSSAKRAARHPRFGDAHLRLLDSIETSRITATPELKGTYFLPRLSAWQSTEYSWVWLSFLLCFASPWIQLLVLVGVVLDITLFDSALGLYLARTDWLEKFIWPRVPEPVTTVRVEPTLESQIRTLESISKLLAEGECDAQMNIHLHEMKAAISEDLRRRIPVENSAKEPVTAVQNPAH